MKKTLDQITKEDIRKALTMFGYKVKDDTDAFCKNLFYINVYPLHECPYRKVDILRSLNYDIPNHYPSQLERVEGVPFDWGNLESLMIDIIRDGIQAQNEPVPISMRILELLKPLQHQPAAPYAVDWSAIRDMLVSLVMDRVGVDDVLQGIKNTLTAKD